MSFELYKRLLHESFHTGLKSQTGGSYEGLLKLFNATLIDCSSLAELVTYKPIIVKKVNPPWPNIFMEFGANASEKITGNTKTLLGSLLLQSERKLPYKLLILPFFGIHNRRPANLGFIEVDLDAQGELLPPSIKPHFPRSLIEKEFDEAISEVIVNLVTNINYFLNRRGERIELAVEALSKREQKLIANKSDKNLPALKSYTLTLHDKKEQLVYPNDESGQHIERMLHAVRGHWMCFENFFNRGPDVVWCPNHIKGNSKKGIVIKDYKIGVPRQEATADIASCSSVVNRRLNAQ